MLHSKVSVSDAPQTPAGFSMCPVHDRPAKVVCVHSSLHTSALVAAKVTLVISGRPADGASSLCVILRWATAPPSENERESAGVVRRIASSDHCRCVSTRCRHISWTILHLPAPDEPREDPLRSSPQVDAEEGTDSKGTPHTTDKTREGPRCVIPYCTRPHSPEQPRQCALPCRISGPRSASR